jgi:hypothetical protein
MADGYLEQEYFSNGTRDAVVMQTRSRKVELPGGCNRGVASAYIFGVICPKDGKGAALVMPRCRKSPTESRFQGFGIKSLFFGGLGRAWARCVNKTVDFQ